MITVRKNFKSLKDLEKFISENTLYNADVKTGELSVVYEKKEEVEVEKKVEEKPKKTIVKAVGKE